MHRAALLSPQARKAARSHTSPRAAASVAAPAAAATVADEEKETLGGGCVAQHRTASLPSGATVHFVDAGPRGKADNVFVLLHGFPDTWLSWRKQIPALAAAGFRVLAVDLRGYGRSVPPSVAVEAFGAAHVVGDLQELLDVVKVKTCTAVGCVSTPDKGLLSRAVGANSSSYRFSHASQPRLGRGRCVAAGGCGAFPRDAARKCVFVWGGAVVPTRDNIEIAPLSSVLNVPHPKTFRDTLRTNLGQLRRSWYIYGVLRPENCLTNTHIELVEHTRLLNIVRRFVTLSQRSAFHAWRRLRSPPTTTRRYASCIKGRTRRRWIDTWTPLKHAARGHQRRTHAVCGVLSAAHALLACARLHGADKLLSGHFSEGLGVGRPHAGAVPPHARAVGRKRPVPDQRKCV